jgi:hypothetical protein
MTAFGRTNTLPTLRLLLAFGASMLAFGACSQPSFTANDVVPPFTGGFGYGSNMGYFPPHFYDKELAALVRGTPDGQSGGAGVTAIRPGLYEHFLDYWGYDIRKDHFQYYDSIGLRNTMVIIGFPAARHRDPAFYCPGAQSELFKDMYEPIWDNGENGTPVNDDNPYALYCWKMATTYKGLIKTWEVWNEPDIDTGNGWLQPGQLGNWWENAPEPCETKLKSPAFFYIRLLRISYEVIKSVDPNSYIAVGGLGWPSYLDVICRHTDNPFDGSEDPDDYPLKGGAYFDCMSFHAYPHIDNSLREWSNDLNGFRNFRHSDAATDGIWRLRDKFRAVLERYGYDNVIYPEKIWICSEFNIPRREFGDYIGSDAAQVNFLIKTLVTAQMEGMAQMYVYSIADEKPEAEATNEYAYMGLFKNLENVAPHAAQPNSLAFAQKTTQKVLGNAKFDPVRTDALQLPAGVRGAAFRNTFGQYTYALWAVTDRDRDETATADYAFPAELGLQFLEAKPWHFSQTGARYLVNAKQVRLSGSPVFLTATLIGNNYPKQPKVVPNPALGGYATYEFWMFEEALARVEIFDASGKLVQKIVEQELLLEGPQARPLDLSASPSGVYFIRLSTPENVLSIPFVKQ